MKAQAGILLIGLAATAVGQIFTSPTLARAPASQRSPATAAATHLTTTAATDRTAGLSPTSLPAVFLRHPPNHRLLALRAARVDAYQQLAQLARQIAGQPANHRGFEAELMGAEVVAVRYYSDGAVEVDMALDAQAVADLLAKLGLGRPPGTWPLRVTGVGLLPPMASRPVPATKVATQPSTLPGTVPATQPTTSPRAASPTTTGSMLPRRRP